MSLSDKWTGPLFLIPLVCRNCMWDKHIHPQCPMCGCTETIRAATILPDTHPARR